MHILKAMNRALNADDPAHYRLPETREAIAQVFLLYTLGLPQGMDINDRVTVKQDALRITTSWTLSDANEIIAAIAAAEARAQALGLDVYATGKTPIWQRMAPYIIDTFMVSLIVAIALMSLLLVVMLRSVKLGLLAMIPNTIPLLIGGGFIVALGRTLDVGGVILFATCLGIAVDDTVHFLANYGRHRRAGHSPEEALARIFTHVVPALSYTTLVLVASFGAFAFADFVPNRFFGIMVAVILSIALVADLVLLPAIVTLTRGLGATRPGPARAMAPMTDQRSS